MSDSEIKTDDNFVFFSNFFFWQNQFKARFKVRTGEDAPFAGIEILRLFRPKQSSEPKPKTSVNEKKIVPSLLLAALSGLDLDES